MVQDNRNIRSLHFENTSQYNPMSKTGGIFTDRENIFLKVKQKANGWLDWFKTKDFFLN